MKKEYKEFFEYYERMKESPETPASQNNTSKLVYGPISRNTLGQEIVEKLLNWFGDWLNGNSSKIGIDWLKNPKDQILTGVTKDGKFVAYNSKDNMPYVFEILTSKNGHPIKGITTDNDDPNGVDMSFDDPLFRSYGFQYDKNATQDLLKNTQQSKTMGLGFTQKNLEALSNSVYRALNKNALNEISNNLLDLLGASEISDFKIIINNITPGSLTEEESFNNTATAEISFVVQMNAIPTTEKTRGFLNKTALKNIRDQVVALLNSKAKKVKEDQDVISYIYTVGKDDRINVVSEKYNKDNVQFTSSGTFSILATKGQSKRSFSSKLGNALNQFNNTTNTLGFNVDRTRGGKV